MHACLWWYIPTGRCQISMLLPSEHWFLIEVNTAFSKYTASARFASYEALTYRFGDISPFFSLSANRSSSTDHWECGVMGSMSLWGFLYQTFQSMLHLNTSLCYPWYHQVMSDQGVRYVRHDFLYLLLNQYWTPNNDWLFPNLMQLYVYNKDLDLLAT